MFYLVVLLVVSEIYLITSSGVTIGIHPYSHPVENQYYSQDGLGSYVYGYITPQSSKTEFRTHDGLTKGGYSYIDPNGEVQTVEYTADAEHGFRVATTNLPKDDPEVAYAKFKHFEEFERIKAQHAALAAEHAALAAKLASLATQDWTEEHLLENVQTPTEYPNGNVQILWHNNSELEKQRLKHAEAYRAALEAHRRDSAANGYTVVNTQYAQEGQEEWENTWEAQKLRDRQQQSTQNHYDESRQIWEKNNQNIEQHRAAYEAVINSEKELIARANAERNRQIQVYQQAQNAYRESLARLEDTRKQQHSAYEIAVEAHRDAAARLEEVRRQQEEAERNWNAIHGSNIQHDWSSVQNNEQHRADYEAALQAEREQISRAQEERNRQLQAYQQAIQRYRESESRLEQIRSQQAAAYEEALQAHKEASRRLEQASNQHEEAERQWIGIQNSEQRKAAYEDAINAEKQLIARTQEIRDRQIQAYQQAQEAYQQSILQIEESKRQQSEAYNSALDSHREAARRLEQARLQTEGAERRLQPAGQGQEWNYINTNSGTSVQQATEDHLRAVEAIKARDRALAEAERAFHQFSVTTNAVGQQHIIPIKTVVSPAVRIAPPIVYGPVSITEGNNKSSQETLNAYSYGSLRIPDIKAAGGYSFIDSNGALQTMQYVSNHLKGFRTSDVNSVIESLKDDSNGRVETIQGIQLPTKKVEVTPQITQEESNRDVEENSSWTGDGASYSSEIQYK